MALEGGKDHQILLQMILLFCIWLVNCNSSEFRALCALTESLYLTDREIL